MKSAGKSPKSLANLLPGGKPGNKGGTGRPPDWLKAKCQKIIDNKKLIEWLGRVAEGEAEDTRIVFDGDNIPHKEKMPASVKDRIHAVEMLLDRGFGRAEQAMVHSGSVDMNTTAAEAQIETGVNSYLSIILAVKIV